MAEIELVAETGRPTGSRSSRRLRREGKVPGVVYGHGRDPVSVAVDARDLRHALNTDAGVNAVVNLRIDGAAVLTMPRVLQRHPVRNNVTHVDFQVVSRDEVVAAEVPVTMVGEAVDVHNADGVVNQQLFALSVLSTPGRIPAHIEVDVSAMQVGDSIRVGDLKLPSGVTTDLDPEEAVVVAQGSQVSELDLIPEADVAGLQELAAAQAAEAAAGGEGAGAGTGAGEGEAAGAPAQG